VTRPPIGVTIGTDARRAGVFLLRQDYLRAVETAGGLPLVLAPGRPEDAADLLDRVQGLVLTGGSDIDPSLYGETRHEQVTQVFRERDDFELALCRLALERDLPLLAICRGCQVLNVASGGTLVQDIPFQLSGAVNHDPERERWEAAHDVTVLPGTKLRAILGRERVAVNSFHHQAVKQIGRALAVSARSIEDGVVEAIEAPDRSFALGVQWHPESFWNRDESFQSLFEALVRHGQGR
jgi:putative glutamine amidotransferase